MGQRIFSAVTVSSVKNGASKSICNGMSEKGTPSYLKLLRRMMVVVGDDVGGVGPGLFIIYLSQVLAVACPMPKVIERFSSVLNCVKLWPVLQTDSYMLAKVPWSKVVVCLRHCVCLPGGK